MMKSGVLGGRVGHPWFTLWPGCRNRYEAHSAGLLPSPSRRHHRSETPQPVLHSRDNDAPRTRPVAVTNPSPSAGSTPTRQTAAAHSARPSMTSMAVRWIHSTSTTAQCTSRNPGYRTFGGRCGTGRQSFGVQPGQRQITSAPSLHQPLRVLGIESSFDDTGVAIVSASGDSGGGDVLGDSRMSQRDQHAHSGGTVPRTAGALHATNLPITLRIALEEAGVGIEEIDAIACTVGPGLAPCLSAGLEFARGLSRIHDKPLIPIHHMEAHALTVRMDVPLPFPYLVLLASGGHCLLLLCEGVGEFRRLGTTLDDAPGEAFDKVSRALGIIGGGAALEHAAAAGDPTAHRFTVPLAATRSCDFSFAGLKTSALREIDRQCALIDPTWAPCTAKQPTGLAHALQTAEVMQRPAAAGIRAIIAAAFQRAVCAHIAARTHRALLYCQGRHELSGLVLSGGVACNSALRTQLETLSAQYGVQTHAPDPALCVDNGVMIAWNGIEKLRNGEVGLSGSAVAELRYTPKWPLGADCSNDVSAANIKVPKARV
eukprot:m.56417 g.56417  ORF g.56417 m.56417 type:complete len:542 (+) comp16968_c0_seq1:163-1788(+)